MKRIVLLLMTTFFLIGCNTDDDTIYDYIGTWSGTYQGSAEKGNFNFVVANDGKVTGTMHSDTNNENYYFTGRLERSGQLNTELGYPQKGTFSGQLADKKGTGDWKNQLPNPARSGTWTAEKNK
ncbi:hypothetical protein ASG01_01945 [Chryseobacterium sp. Leaf180]|uniref:hypothetical protein n=1 Tax=Chryseobacterium sp. Leaf180 TaxID=1736289 RepID=UPI0006F35433|nr:hypothetical protein [Chryseobacterium sp. Leaf180]KQR94664.1 hypothetical protein ASG01_01945 [Chryseobacterium sp. Leaf180]